MSRVFKIDGEEFEAIQGPAVTLSKWLVDSYKRLGSPDDPFSEQGERVMNMIVHAWEYLDPRGARERRESIKEYRDNELSNAEKVKRATGRNIASVPTPVYHLMKKFFPQFKLDNRDNFIKLVKKYPYFQVTEKI